MTEDEDGRELLRPLLAEPAPPSGLEVAGLVRKGRNRVRTRRLLGTGGAATAALVVIPLAFSLVQGVSQAPRPQASPGVAQTSQSAPAKPAPPPAPPAACVPAGLPVPDWSVDSYVLGGDPTGRYLVGWAAADDGFRTPLLWDRGSLVVLESPTRDIGHLAVNSSGVVAGSGMDGGSKNIAWVFRDGQYSILAQPEEHVWEFVSAVAINEHGDVLGSDNNLDINENTGEYYPQQLPLVWPADAPGKPRQLPAPDGPGMVRANGIDDDGMVVGARISLPALGGETGERFSHSLVWNPGGSARELDGDSLDAVRNGWAVGPRKAGAFRWNLSTGEEKRLRLAFASSVNAHGWVAGQTRQGRISTPAVEFGTGKVLKLPLPDGAVPGTDGVGATFVSDDGRVVGGAVATDPVNRMAASWSCG